MKDSFLNGAVTLHHGDCLIILQSLATNSIDSVVTDPPYHLTTGKKGGTGEASLNLASPAGRARISTGGFMGKHWDGGGVAFDPETWIEILRIMKPGAHLVAFGGTRTYHRLACAIEDAGFEIRDAIMWHYGNGFPKSHDVSKAIDRAAGAKREIIERRTDGPSSWMLDQKIEHRANGGTGMGYADGSGKEYDVTAPATEAARQWEGWGTALKPATEIICLARKPLSEATIAANVLRWGAGALNIDGCRIEGAVPKPGNINPTNESGVNGIYGRDKRTSRQAEWEPSRGGRWPANLCHDGSEEVLAKFPVAPGQQRYVGPEHGLRPSRGIYGDFGARPPTRPRGDSRSAARFFYHAKAGKRDRFNSKHPTIKPVDLLQWLCRLVTPPNGIVLDPFAGTGTTGQAAFLEGFRAMLIEREEEYCVDIERRILALDSTSPII